MAQKDRLGHDFSCHTRAVQILLPLLNDVVHTYRIDIDIAIDLCVSDSKCDIIL